MITEKNTTLNTELLNRELAIRGMNLNQVAAMMGMSEGYLRGLIEGKNGEIRLRHMEAIRKNTGIPPQCMAKIFFGTSS